jgi:hypothetical protein
MSCGFLPVIPPPPVLTLAFSTVFTVLSMSFPAFIYFLRINTKSFGRRERGSRFFSRERERALEHHCPEGGRLHATFLWELLPLALIVL